MAHVFLIADPHFSHTGVTKFLRDDGTKLRPFDTPEEMDEALFKNWNSVVQPGDKVYVLGDIVMKRKYLPIVERLNGRKCLIAGNHDIESAKDYLKYFYDVRAFHYLDRLALTHIPIHPDSLGRYICNIHGHIHQRTVMMLDGDEFRVPDPRYFCISAEQINYTPIEWNDLRKKFYSQLGLEIKNS